MKWKISLINILGLREWWWDNLKYLSNLFYLIKVLWLCARWFKKYKPLIISLLFNLMQKERVMIFIDGSNLYYSLKDLGVNKIGFQNLLKLLVKGKFIVSTYYYNAPLDISINQKKYWEQQKFFDMLRKLPDFNVVLCRMRKHRKDGKFIFDVKGDDVYLAVDLVSGAYENLYDIAIIVSGDEDFVPAIQKAQKLGKKVVNAYFKSTSSNYLKHTCDESFCIDNIINEIKK